MNPKKYPDEIKRIKKDYGNRSILLDGGPLTPLTVITRPLGLFGGYTEAWTTNSFGSWTYTPKVIGFHQNNMWDQTINDRFDLRNCETIVMMGLNPAWSAMGSSTLNYLEAKKAGAKFIAIDPIFNESYNLLDAKWLPTRPTTDTALLLGVAHSLLILDDPIQRPLVDWDFLYKCTVGFDAEHVADGANPKDNFKDYVLGTYDNQPKTAEWASEICGVEANEIKQLALSIGKNRKVALLTGFASARTRNTDNLPQLVMAIGAMTGHIGKSGHMTGPSTHVTSGNGGDNLIKEGKTGLPEIKNPVDDSINGNELWDAVLTGKYTWTGAGSMMSPTQFSKGETRAIDIKIVYHGIKAMLQTNEGLVKGIEAHKKVDLVVSHDFFLSTNAKYSDIVLPVTTPWEQFGGTLGGGLIHSSNREIMIHYSQVIEPYYEAKSDGWIAVQLGKKLGLNQKDIMPFSEKQIYFNKISTTTIIDDDDGKTYIPFLTITQEDIDELGVEGKPQKGKVSYKEFKEKGIYQIKRHKDDNLGYIAYENFRKDPEKNPLKTSTGKMEISSPVLEKKINDMGFSKIKPYPTYIRPIDGYEDTFADWEKKIKGKYPYQVINPHYLRRSHTAYDNVQWLQEAWKNPVYLSGRDARDKGIKDGDVVLIESPYGKVLRNAVIFEGVMPGVVALPHGAWSDIDIKTGVDIAGSDNTLSRGFATGKGVSGYNTNIVNISKYDGEQIDDVKRPQRIVL